MTSTGKGVDAWNDVKGEQMAPVLEYTDLAGGAIVKHVATKNIEKGGRRYQLHTFQAGAGTGQVFAVWGAAELNGKIRALRPAAIIYIQYGGKQPHPDDLHLAADKQRTQHVFIVKEAPKGADVTEARAGLDEPGLEKRIRLALERERTERAEREPPPHTDDDFPFGKNARA